MLNASLIQLEYASRHWKSTFSYFTPLVPAPRSTPHTMGPGPGALSLACPLARVLCPPLCLPHACLSHHRWRPCPSRVPAPAPCRALCPSFRCLRPCLSRAPALPRCCWHWRPARAPAPARRRVRPGPSPVFVPSRSCPRLRPPLVHAVQLRLPPSHGCCPLLAPRPRAGPPPHRLRAPSAAAVCCPAACAWASGGRRAATSPLERRASGSPAWGGWCGYGSDWCGAGLGPLSALCRGRGSPRRSAWGQRGAHLPCRRCAGGRGVAGWSGGRGPLRIRGPSWGRGGRSSGLGGRGGLPRPGRIWGRRLGVAGGSLGLLGRRPNRYRGLCQLPLLVLCGGFPRTSRGDRGAGAGPAVVAVVLLGGAIRVRHRGYPGRHARLQACPSQCLPMRRWRAVGRVVRCSGGGGGWLWWRLWAVRGRWPSTGTGAGGGRATQPTPRAKAPSPWWGSGPWVLRGRAALPRGAAQGGTP